jgi:hypothetical protein
VRVGKQRGWRVAVKRNADTARRRRVGITTGATSKNIERGDAAA